MKYFSSGQRALLTAILLAALTSGSYASDGLILPMPGKKDIEKASAAVNLPPKKQPEVKKPDGSSAIIPLPKQIKPLPQTQKPVETATATPIQDKPLLPIAAPPPPPDPVLMDDIPVPPDEVVISPNDSMNDLIPPPPPPEVPAGSSSSGTLPVFPKDTSSAIFMVMKSWQCDNYDGNTLLSHAVEVYSKEADDTFKIEGLSPSEEFLITVEEEDITLDELLDILAMKSGRDWGVDIPSKIIYFYPKGVKADAYNVW